MFADLVDTFVLVSQIVAILFMAWAAVCVVVLMFATLILFDDWRSGRKNGRHNKGPDEPDESYFSKLITDDLGVPAERTRVPREVYLEDQQIEFRGYDGFTYRPPPTYVDVTPSVSHEEPTMVHPAYSEVNDMTAVMDPIKSTTPPDGIMFVGGVATPTSTAIPLDIKESDEDPAVQPH